MNNGSLYNEYVAWYPLLDPIEDHAAECGEFLALIYEALGEGRHRLLELGSGAGNNAAFLSTHLDVTLSDVSPQMLALSKHTNPELEHIQADMHTLRLERSFDAVLVHDSVCHMTTRDDVLALAHTIAAHLRPGGVALVVPDCVAESFEESIDDDAVEGADRGLQYVVRSWQPDPEAEVYQSDYAFLLRDEAGLHAVHMSHSEGLFSTETWKALLEAAGLQAQAVPRTLPDGEQDGPYWDHLWLCTKPTG